MTNFQAEMFNKKASEPKNKPDQIIESMHKLFGHNIPRVTIIQEMKED